MLKRWILQSTWGKIGILFLGFIVWMSFFDRNNWWDQSKQNRILNQLEEDKLYYTTQIEVLRQNREALFSNSKNLEQFARERYKMKKEEEDIFVIQEEPSTTD